MSMTRLHLAPLVLLLCFAVAPAFAQQHPPVGDPNDPRVGLSAGWTDAEEAASNLELIVNTPRPAAFSDPENPGNFAVANSDMAFYGDHVIVGNFNGFMVYDVSDPRNPRLRVSVVCPGGQGDISVYENLLFMSVEEARGRIDCGPAGAPSPVDPERFRGIRVFDLSNLDSPTQVAAVQTCRGSHTHTLVPHPSDARTVYVYNSGASFVRPGEEMAGCSPLRPDEDAGTSLFRIEVIEVLLDAPQNARVVSEPRIFADPATGDVAGLWRGGTHGADTQQSRETNHCHDITAFPELGIAAGACSGNGILIDISDPVNPVRIAAVTDPSFAYWHSATFNNDGTKVIFTDEWGGGTSPRCRATDPATWGANAIFDLVDGRELVFAGYYKLPAHQTATENCVAHNGSLIPVPGRDIMVQAWYQGGLSVFDFTDASSPVEIAFFDRGPLSDTQLHLGGYWSTYWYNGLIYGTEIARGLDILRLRPSEHLTQNEIDAAMLVRYDDLNPQTQERLSWPATPAVAGAYLDQLERTQSMTTNRLAQLRSLVAQRSPDFGNHIAQLEADAAASAAVGRPTDANRLTALAATLRGM
ncbi:hypothetical protein BH23BAC4_BH23BAC4_17210 [soil metagenome]